jgi:hypothetical protein
MLVCVLLGSDLSESMVSSCSGVPCCVIDGWFNGNQLMVDFVAHCKGLFRSYASPVWDPHQITTTRDIEQVQRRAARFAYNCYQDNSPGCVTNLLNSLQRESLLTLKSSREQASTTEDGTWFHSLMDLGKKEWWYVSFC